MGMFPFVTTKTLLRELNQPLTKPTLTPMVTYLVVEGIRDCKSEGIFLVFYTKWETLFGVRSAAGDSVWKIFKPNISDANVFFPFFGTASNSWGLNRWSVEIAPDKGHTQNKLKEHTFRRWMTTDFNRASMYFFINKIQSQTTSEMLSGQSVNITLSCNVINLELN